MNMKYSTMKHQLRITFAAIALAGVCSLHAMADTLVIGGFTYNGVVVEGVDAGKLVYTSSSGSEVSVDLKKVEVMKLDRLPEFTKAEEARAADKLPAAIRDYRAAAQRAQTDWAKKLAQWRLYDVATKADNAPVALQAYLALLQLNANLDLIGEAPVALVAKLNAKERERLFQSARAVHAQSRGEMRKQAGVIMEIALNMKKGNTEAVQQAVQSSGAEQAARLKNAKFGEALQPLGLILFSKAEEPGVTELISVGEFVEATNKAVESMRVTQGLPRKLYLLGMAQLAIAEQSKKQEDYLDAAISFMRVPIHYQRHSYRIPCLVEAAYCHLQIGRPDLASKLLGEAEKELDESEYPEYTKRIDTLRGKISQSAGQ